MKIPKPPMPTSRSKVQGMTPKVPAPRPPNAAPQGMTPNRPLTMPPPPPMAPRQAGTPSVSPNLQMAMMEAMKRGQP